MKKTLIPLLVVIIFASCSERSGCPTNGKNIGAERILSNDKSAIKAMKKAPKFKA
jgi:hypothetical protein